MQTVVDIGTLTVKTPGTCGGCPRIAGHRLTVHNIAIDFNVGKPEDSLNQHLQLSLAKIYAALTYYFTNKEVIDDETIVMQRVFLEEFLQRQQPQKVVIEICTNSNWAHDICQEHGYEVLVANPNQEAWQWRNVKRKTDTDDALKLVKLAALEQISPVYVLSPQIQVAWMLIRFNSWARQTFEHICGEQKT